MTLVAHQAPPAPLALTSDELRALARCLGAPLTSLLLDGDDEADAPVADAVALRGLAARGLLSMTGDPTLAGAIRLSAGARRVLGPVLAPEALVEIEADRVGSPFVERHVVCAGAGRTLVLSEADEADVWILNEGASDLGLTVAAVVGLPEEAGDGGGRGRRLAVPATAHDAADEALEHGGDAVAVLVAAGADPDAAAAWIAAVVARVVSVELRAARLLPGDVVDAAELRILAAGSLGTWLLDLEGPDQEPDEEWAQGGDVGDPWGATTSVVTEVGGAAAGAALAGLLTARPSAPR